MSIDRDEVIEDANRTVEDVAIIKDKAYILLGRGVNHGSKKLPALAFELLKLCSKIEEAGRGLLSELRALERES